jgi:hypothetical protein
MGALGSIECKGDMVCCQQGDKENETVIPVTNVDSELFATPFLGAGGATDSPFVPPNSLPESPGTLKSPDVKVAAPRAEKAEEGAGVMEQPDEEPEEKKPKVRRWRVELNKVDGLPLGFQAQVQIGLPYITVGALQTGELVDKFNQENPEYALQEGDRIIAIGGVGGESRTLLKKLARVRDSFVFDCERPLE